MGYIMFGDKVEHGDGVYSNIDFSSVDKETCSSVSQVFRPFEHHISKIDILFTDIPDYPEGALILKIKNNVTNRLLYQANLSIAGICDLEWKEVPINIVTNPNYTYTLTIEANENSSDYPSILIGDGVLESTGDWAAGEKIENGQLAIRYHYASESTSIDRTATVVIWGIVLLLVLSLYYYWDKLVSLIQAWFQKMMGSKHSYILLLIFEMLLCYYILTCSGVPFEDLTKVLLMAVSCLSVWNYTDRYTQVKEIFDCAWKKNVRFILYLYAAFAFTGQRIFTYPINIRITLDKVCVYIATVLWVIPVIDSCIYLFMNWKDCLIVEHKKKMSWKLILSMILIMIVPAAIHLYANNPGISSYDTAECMAQYAHNLRGMPDWHPVFYCILLNLILKVWDSTYAVILCQYVFWCYVMISAIVFLRRKGFKDSVCLGIACLLGFNAANFVQMNTIWKDIPYTLSLVLLLLVLAKLILDYDYYKKKWFIYLELLLALSFTCLLRQNGIVPYVLVMVGMLIVLRKNIKIWIAAVLSVIVIIGVKGPVYKALDIEKSGHYGMYIGLSQDILGVYYAGGELDEATLEMIPVMTDYNNAEYLYKPSYATQSYELDVPISDFLGSYIRTFFRNPVFMTRALIDREDFLWNIYEGEDVQYDCIDYEETVENREEWVDSWLQYYPARKYVSIKPAVTVFTANTVFIQCLYAIIWRCGIYTLLGMVMLVTTVMKKGFHKYMLLVVPIVGQILSLLLSTGWSDFRYFWPLNLMNLLLIFVLMIVMKENDKDEAVNI